MARSPLEGPEQLFHFTPAYTPPPADARAHRGAEPGEKLLITGLAGGQGRLIARRVADSFQIGGADRVPWEGAPHNARLYVVNLRKRKVEDRLRPERPQPVGQLALV